MKKRLEFSSIERYGIKLRLVEITDAEFILKLRTDSKLGKHLSETSIVIADQVEWIAAYKQREALGLEYYFVTVGPNGERWGTTRLSELDGLFFELGSWLFDPSAPAGVAIKADIITKEIGFRDLGFDHCKFDVRKSNLKVLKYHQGFCPIVVSENELNFYFNLSKDLFEKRRDKLIKLL